VTGGQAQEVTRPTGLILPDEAKFDRVADDDALSHE
jgi:hypothetical protein